MIYRSQSCEARVPEKVVKVIPQESEVPVRVIYEFAKIKEPSDEELMEYEAKNSKDVNVLQDMMKH